MKDTYHFLNFRPTRSYVKKDGSRGVIPTMVTFLLPSDDERVRGLKTLDMEADERLEPKLSGVRPLQFCDVTFGFDKQEFGNNVRVRFTLSDIHPVPD